MNQAELIKKVSDATGQTKAASTAAVKAVVAAMGDALVAGEEVSVFGFGRFTVADRAARVARSPRDGSEIQVPAHKVVKFKASSVLKASINA